MTAYDWRSRAVCAALRDPDDMFPDSSDRAGLAFARMVCSVCPVKQACLEEAIAEEGGRTKDSRFGVRAGRTPSQRYGIYQSRRPSAQSESKPRGTGRALSPCGTPAAYDRHCREGEPIDEACREAHNAKNREQKAKQRARAAAGTEAAA